MATLGGDGWACSKCTFQNAASNKICEMCESKKPEDSTTSKFKKLIGNVASTSKLFTAANPDTNTNGNNNTHATSSSSSSSSGKSNKELEDEIEILKLQKEDLRKLVQERTYELDQLKKLDGEHQKLRQRWQENEERALNEVKNVGAYTEELKAEIAELKKQNMLLQSKQTNNDVIKNKLENELRELQEQTAKTKKLMDRKIQEKKMLVAEVLKLRNEKQELIATYKAEIERLNQQNQHNIEQLKELQEQQRRSQQLEFDANMRAANNKYDELSLIYTNYKHNITQKISNIDSTTNAFESMITNANVGNLSQDECNKILDNIIHSIETMEKENEQYNQVLHKKKSQHMDWSKATESKDDDTDDDGNDDDEHEQQNGERAHDDGEQEEEEEAEHVQEKHDGESKNGHLYVEQVSMVDDDGIQFRSKTPGGSQYNYKIDMDEDMLLNQIESRVLKTLREKALLQRSSNQLMFQLQQLQSSHEEEIKAKNDVIYQHELRQKVSFFPKKKNQNKV